MGRLTPIFPSRVSLMSKLVIRSDYRSSGVAFRLTTAAYRCGRKAGDQLTFLYCRPHLFCMYPLMRMRLYRPNIHLPIVGTVIPWLESWTMRSISVRSAPGYIESPGT